MFWDATLHYDLLAAHNEMIDNVAVLPGLPCSTDQQMCSRASRCCRRDPSWISHTQAGLVAHQELALDSTDDRFMSTLSIAGRLTSLLACTGTRAKLYTLTYSCGLAGNSLGPLAAAAAFAISGNKWQVHTLQHVILVGLVIALLPVITLLLFDDEKALPSERHRVSTASEESPASHSEASVQGLSSQQHVPESSQADDTQADSSAAGNCSIYAHTSRHVDQASGMLCIILLRVLQVCRRTQHSIIEKQMKFWFQFQMHSHLLTAVPQPRPMLHFISMLC